MNTISGEKLQRVVELLHHFGHGDYCNERTVAQYVSCDSFGVTENSEHAQWLDEASAKEIAKWVDSNYDGFRQVCFEVLGRE